LKKSSATLIVALFVDSACMVIKMLEKDTVQILGLGYWEVPLFSGNPGPL